MSKATLEAKWKQRRADWRERIERQRVSGQSVMAFCRAESVPVQTYYTWKARLRAEAVKGTIAERAVRPEIRFIDAGPVGRTGDDRSNLDSLPTATAHASGRFELRLELGAGVVLHLSRS